MEYLLIGCYPTSGDFGMPIELGCGTYEEMEVLLDDYLHDINLEYDPFGFKIISKNEWYA